MGSLLRMVEVPSSGGTLFASMYAAFDALSGRMQRLLCGLTAVHEGEQYYRGRYGSGDLRDAAHPVAEHPVVRTHPITGRQAVFANEAFTTRLKDLPLSESDALLAFLFKHSANPVFQCRFHWRPHSIAFWDNRCTQAPCHLRLPSGGPPRLSGHDQRRPPLLRPRPLAKSLTKRRPVPGDRPGTGLMLSGYQDHADTRCLALASALVLAAVPPLSAQPEGWSRPFPAPRVIGNLYSVGTTITRGFAGRLSALRSSTWIRSRLNAADAPGALNWFLVRAWTYSPAFRM